MEGWMDGLAWNEMHILGPIETQRNLIATLAIVATGG
jgi:hypothetical protein